MGRTAWWTPDELKDAIERCRQEVEQLEAADGPKRKIESRKESIKLLELILKETEETRMVG